MMLKRNSATLFLLFLSIFFFLGCQKQEKNDTPLNNQEQNEEHSPQKNKAEIKSENNKQVLPKESPVISEPKESELKEMNISKEEPEETPEVKIGNAS